MRTLVLTLTLAALGLAACEEGDARRSRLAGGGGEGICKPFGRTPAASPGPFGAAGPEASMAVDDCLHRWGYTLARAEDEDADVVAQAVVSACSTQLARWNQQTLGLAAASGDDRPSEAPSLLTGQPTNPIAEHNAFAERQAIFYVVQARAGKCDPPRDDDRDDDRDGRGGAGDR
jgi:hypothetical protein